MVFRFWPRRLCSFLFTDFFGLDGSSSVLFGGFRRLLLFLGLLLAGQPVLFLFSVFLFLVCSWGLCSSSFPPSRLWSSRLDLSFCRRALGLLFASGGVFLPSLPSGSVGSPGFPRLSVPLYSGGALPRVGLVLCLRVVSVRLPSFLPLLLLRCLSAWWWFFPLGGLLLYGCLGSLIQQWSTVVLCSVVCLPPSLPLHCRGSVFFLRLRFVLRLSPLVIFLSAFAMWSPWAGSSVGVGSSTRSERRLSLLVSFVFLRDGVTLWVKWFFHSPLISIEGLL